MTTPYAAYGPASLDFRSLIAHLSHPSRFRNASSIRNHLLAAYSAASEWRAGEGAAEEADAEPWETLSAYREGSTVLCVGDVPREVLLDADEKKKEEKEGVWAVLHVYAAPGSVPARITLWLSSEPSLPSPSPPPELESSHALLSHLLSTHIPSAVRKLAQHKATKGSEADFNTATLCALEHRWLDFLESPHAATESAVKVDWQNRCARYYGRLDAEDAAHFSEVGAEARDGDGGASVRVGRWECHGLREGAEVELARASNKIPFPLAYVRARAHLSVCVRDAEGDTASPSSPTESEDSSPDLYPLTRFKCAAAGFVYAHEELALAALHVTPPYRRLGASSSTGAKPPSVGRLLLRTMGPLLVRAQRRALKRAGIEWSEVQRDGEVDVAPVIADTELANTAHGFFLAAGFVRGRGNAWVGITLLGG